MQRSLGSILGTEKGGRRRGIGEEKGRESEEGVRIGEPFGDILTRVATD